MTSARHRRTNPQHRRLVAGCCLFWMVLRELRMARKVPRSILFRFVELRDFFGSEPFVDGRMQDRIRIDLTEGFCPLESPTKIPGLTSVVLWAERVGA